jgi:dTMP kinase
VNRPEHLTGHLITFEGIDGCGKTTQLSLAADWLRSRGREVVTTKEPGGTEVGRRIREIVLSPATGHLAPETELGLMFSARAQHLEEVIRPALADGKLVLCDRFTDSTIAYQGYGRGISLERIAAVDQLLCGAFRPDLTLIVDIEPEIALQRANSRNREAEQKESRFENEGLNFLRRVRQGFCTIAEREPDRAKLLDGRGEIEEVQRRVRTVIEEFLK